MPASVRAGAMPERGPLAPAWRPAPEPSSRAGIPIRSTGSGRLDDALALAGPASRVPSDQHLPPPPVRRAAPLPSGGTPFRARLFVPSRAWGGRRRREILFGAAAIAVVFHVLLTIAILEAPRLWPVPAHPVPPAEQQEPPTIEMVTDQNKYAGGSKPTPPSSPTPPAPKAPPAPPKPQASPTPSDMPSPPAPSPDPVPPDAPTRGQVQAPSPAPPQQQAQSEPQVDLDPADGLGYGRQDDPHIIPATPDDRHANKMPPYPRAAGQRGEEGTVQMLVSIQADGSVRSVEIATSSGYNDLDRTAQNAVSHWHFRPAIQNGVAVPTQVMQVFNYKIDR